jgi:glutathione reductase (NADPH)
MASRFDYDLFTIGAGSGGVRASRMAASYGARAAVAEERDLGGTCVNLGCIPKKLLVYAAEIGWELEDAAGLGWTVGEARFSWPELIARKNAEIARLNGVYAGLLDEAGVRRIQGRARVIDAHTVAVGGRRYTAGHILVATGSWPALPPVPGIEHAITSNETFHLPALPRRALIVGGGYIALEFACIFRGMGAEVTVVHRGQAVLRGFDDDVRRTLGEELAKQGIALHLETTVARLERAGGEVRATLAGGATLAADLALFATGRAPLTRGFGLEEAGVALDGRGAVVVDAYSRSSVPSIWAIGDATDRRNLTPVAIHEAMAFARTVFGGEPTRPDHTSVASCVFSRPEVGTVGLTEAEARERHRAVDVYRTSFRPLKHTLTGRDERAMMKLVVDGATDRVLGCHVVGAGAGEIIQGFAVALKCRATKAQLDATAGVHPTAAEELVTMREKVADRPRS